MADTPRPGPSRPAAEPFAVLSLDQQRELVLQLAPRVLARLSDEEQQAFLQELEENLMLARATAHAEKGTDSSVGAWEMPTGE